MTGGAYRLVWAALAGFTVAVGGAVALLSVPPAEVVGMAAAGLTLTCMGRSLVDKAPSRSTRLRHLLEAALIGAGGTVTLIGVVAFLGWMGVVWVSILAVASPAAVCWWMFAGRMASTLIVEQPAAATGSSDSLLAAALRDTLHPSARSLSDAQLCLAWRCSFTALQRARDLMQRVCLVGDRQEYLDELERRNPRGFARWLYAGARPASDPSRYVLSTIKPSVST